MKARISVLTLGVENLDRAVQLYRDGLGLATEGIVRTEFEYRAVALFDLPIADQVGVERRLPFRRNSSAAKLRQDPVRPAQKWKKRRVMSGAFSIICDEHFCERE